MMFFEVLENGIDFRGGRVSLGPSYRVPFGKGHGGCEGVASQDFFKLKAVRDG